MRITFIAPTPNLSGGIKVIAIYARLLAERGHAVTIISQPPAVLPLRRKIKSFVRGRGWPRNAGTQPTHLDGLPVDHRMLDARRAPRDADVPDGDVVVATWWETAFWVAALGAAKGAKAYFIQGHEVFPHLPVQRVRQTYHMPLHKIVVARWLRDVMRDEYGDTAIDVVPNAVDHRQFHALPRGRQARPTLGFLFSETQLKGLDIALQVVERMRRKHADLRVICFGGNGPSAAGILDEGIELAVAPPQESIRDIYAQCDVWLAASRSEGFNLPAMEAMACRTPVVSTRTGWPAEAITDGRNGMLAEIDDVEGLTRGIETILALPNDAWRRLSEHAYQTVQGCSWESSAALFEQALANAVGRAENGAMPEASRHMA